jgi:hypothetical protein
MMRRIRIVAILAGLAADLIGTILFSTVLTVAFLAFRHGSGDSAQTALQRLSRDTSFLVIGYFGGIAFTFLGAYITARMSRPHSVLNTLIFGVSSTLFIVFFASMYPLWYNALCVLTIIPFSLLPGYSIARNNDR